MSESEHHSLYVEDLAVVRWIDRRQHSGQMLTLQAAFNGGARQTRQILNIQAQKCKIRHLET
jgi:hypothetical protein